jgi:hypothetical protein
VEPQSGAPKTYTVTVTPKPNTAKEITAFYFTGYSTLVTPDDSSAIISAVPNASGEYPIEVTVPLGTSLTNLAPHIIYTGNSILGLNDGLTDTSGPATVVGSGYSFSGANLSLSAPAPIKYKVTAEDTTTKTYAVTVRIAGTTGDDKKEITGFYFTNPLAVGTINEAAKTITVSVPTGTDLSSLQPTVYFKGRSLKPGSGVVNNFTSPVIYTVTANDNTTQPYTVTVKITPSGAKDITRFTFPGIITETVIGAVPNDDGTYPIAVWVPAGTPLGSLAPAITHTGISISPASGRPQNFTNPQSYTVTAEDGSAKTYCVTLRSLDSDVKIITSFIFGEVLITGGTIRAVGSIDQDSHTITVEVPSTATVTGLKPTITYLGKSITVPSASGTTTANPFTDTVGVSFTGPQNYTVTPQSGGAGQPYTVTVIRRTAVTVTFEGDVDRDVIASNTFDQSTGVITITVNNSAGSGVESPYEWYVNGVKRTVPDNTAITFTLNVGNGSFIPGRHEIMVSGRLNGLHYTGKVYFVVAE